MEEQYKALAERNGWDYSFDGERPYFMKAGRYAVPDDNTSEEDKELLANVISEGSIELERLILLCWDNGIAISGPCSGIDKYHSKQPVHLHFSCTASKELIDSLTQNLQAIFPNFGLMLRDMNGQTRLDIRFTTQNGITQEQSDAIFSVIRDNLEYEISKQKEENPQLS